jgi:hypothetical protein
MGSNFQDEMLCDKEILTVTTQYHFLILLSHESSLHGYLASMQE